jgi:hypothetical protein
MTPPKRNHPAAVDAIHLRPQAVTAHWVRELRNYARYEASTPAAAKAAFEAGAGRGEASQVSRRGRGGGPMTVATLEVAPLPWKAAAANRKVLRERGPLLLVTSAQPSLETHLLDGAVHPNLGRLIPNAGPVDGTTRNPRRWSFGSRHPALTTRESTRTPSHRYLPPRGP